MTPDVESGSLRIRSIDRLFLHFLDLYHYQIALAARKDFSLVHKEFRDAFRISALLADELYIPASAFFENAAVQGLLDEHSEFGSAGFIFLCAGDATLKEHFEKKKTVRYDRDSDPSIRKSYHRFPDSWLLYRSEVIKTGARITEAWRLPSSLQVLEEATKPGRKQAKRLFETLPLVPEILQRRALVVSHINHELEARALSPIAPLALLRILDPAFTESYALPLKCGIVRDLFYVQLPWEIPLPYAGYSYRQAVRVLIKHGLMDDIRSAPCSALLRLKYSDIWRPVRRVLSNDQSLREQIKAQSILAIRHILHERPYQMPSTSGDVPHPPIAIITALPEEWAAVVKLFGAQLIPSRGGDPNRYSIASIPTGADTSRHLTNVIVALLPRMGTNSASVVTTNLLRSYPDVQDAIFCGIALGVPNPGQGEDHVRLGDVIVSDNTGVVQIDLQVVKKTGVQNRSQMPPPSRKLLNAVRILQASELVGERPWEGYLSQFVAKHPNFERPDAATDLLYNDRDEVIDHPKDERRRPGLPRIFHGPIGSGNTLFRHGKARNTHARRHKLKAIEMEGAGTAEAVWHFGKSYLIVRGSCDYGDSKKGDVWHNYAAASAASYLKALLEFI